jgi:hypothetical protein
MTTSLTPGATKAIRRVAWPHRQTFATPLKDLDGFVAAILSGIPGLAAGWVIVESIVFDPKHLQELMRRYDVPFEPGHDLTITGDDPVETAALLRAALADWVDFVFIPTPKRSCCTVTTTSSPRSSRTRDRTSIARRPRWTVRSSSAWTTTSGDAPSAHCHRL